MRKHSDHIKSLFEGDVRGIPVLSIIINFNDDYEGGDLVFWNDHKVDLGEGDIVVFPSKALHGTQANKSNMGRISISGDIVCVAKESKLLENMMPPVSNWDKM